MSHSKSKNNSKPPHHNQSANTYTTEIKPSVHIFPTNHHPYLLQQLTLKLDLLHLVSDVHRNYSDLESIVENASQYSNKQICLIELQGEEQGSDCCFPKNYAFPNVMNIYIVFFSFKPIRTNRPHLLSLNQITSFCEKELKPHKIKLKSIQNLRNDSKSKNSSSHSTQKQKLSFVSHSLISQIHSQQYQLLFYLVSEELRTNLNQNQFNYQMLVRSIQKLQKCQPFTSLQKLLKKQVHKKQKKYLILFHLSSSFLSILNKIKKEQLYCFHIILYGDLKPINLYLEKYILLATSDSNLIFKFLKNHGFDTPQLRQQHFRNSRRYSISSNDFRNQMDNLMNQTSQYSPDSTFLNSVGQPMQGKKKTIRHWLVDKNGPQSNIFVTTLVNIQQFQTGGSVFNKIKSLQKSRLSNNGKMLKRSYISPKKQSSLKFKQTQQEFQTNELQLYSNIAVRRSRLKQKKSQINQQSIQKQQVFLKYKQNAQIEQDEKNYQQLKNVQQKDKESVSIDRKLKIVNNQIAIKLQSQQELRSKNSKMITQKQKQRLKNCTAPHQVIKKSSIEKSNVILQSNFEQPERIKRQSIRASQNQYYSTLTNNKKSCNQPNTKTQNNSQIRTNTLLLRNNSNKIIANFNSVANRQNMIKRVNMKSLQEKTISPELVCKNVENKKREFKTLQREQLLAKKNINVSQSLDLSNTLNISSSSKSKYKYSYFAEKSKINTCICGVDFIEQNISKLKYLKIDICKFHYIIEEGLAYINRALQSRFAFPSDKIRTYKSIHELYQFLRLEEEYELGFIFCLSRNTKLINLKLLPQHYFLVNLENHKDSFVEISEQARKIKIGEIKYFELAQSMLLEQKMQQYVLYRKNNKNVLDLVNKFKNSEFIIEAVHTKFSLNIIDTYFNDYSRLTRLFFICDEAQLPQLQETILKYQSQNQFFLAQSCNIICVLQNKAKKILQQNEYARVGYVIRGDLIQDYNQLLNLFKKPSGSTKNKIQQQLIFVPDSLSIEDLFNEEYPGRFQFISYSHFQQAEQIANNKKIQDKETKIYLLTLQTSSKKSLIFDKQFALTKVKNADSSKITVTNVLEMLQLLRF